MTQKFLVIIENGLHNYSAYSPDVPGCVSTGKTVEETLQNMKEALEFHLESLVEDSEEIPFPKSLNYYLEQTDEVSSDDIITHLNIEIREPEFA